MRRSRALLSLVVLFGTSCVPPTCFNWAYDYSQPKRLVTLHTLTDPHQGAPDSGHHVEQYGSWFHHGVSIDINAAGSMAVQRKMGWPDRCPQLAADDLEKLSQAWEPFLEKLSAPHTYWRTLRNPMIDDEDRHPEGPLVEIGFYSIAGKSLSLQWDGSRLPEELEPAVMATLETMCSNSDWARRLLARDLPTEVASRLSCS